MAKDILASLERCVTEQLDKAFSPQHKEMRFCGE